MFEFGQSILISEAYQYLQAHENINKFLKKGKELAIPLEYNLRNIMWEYCGVVKNKELLSMGLQKIRVINIKFNN